MSIFHLRENVVSSPVSLLQYPKVLRFSKHLSIQHFELLYSSLEFGMKVEARSLIFCPDLTT